MTRLATALVVALALVPPAFGEEADPAQAAWIAEKIRVMKTGTTKEHDDALAALVSRDNEGDHLGAVFALMDEFKKQAPLLGRIIRGLGKDGLDVAAPVLAKHLTHKDERVRGYAAVSLEYIGCRDKKVIASLRKLADKEKNPAIANHAFRALGRCGVGDAKTRAFLLKKSGSAKSEYASYGPVIGLAYFEGDAKAARGVEKLLKKIGVPGSRRAGGQNAVKRSLVSWTLASIGDKKSAVFVREELMKGLEHVQAEWVDGLSGFWDTVARVCEGERALLPNVEAGVRGAVTYVKRIDLARYGAETRHLMDEYRNGRGTQGFTPKGDHILNDERGS